MWDGYESTEFIAHRLRFLKRRAWPSDVQAIVGWAGFINWKRTNYVAGQLQRAELRGDTEEITRLRAELETLEARRAHWQRPPPP